MNLSLARVRQATAAMLVAGVAVAAAGCSAMPRPLGSKIHVTADFANIAGMYEGNYVAVLGIPVGKVDKITPRGTYVQVQMSIDKDTPIPADVLAALVSPSIVTDRHVELTPAYTGSGPTLKDGDHLVLERTRTPVEIDTMVKTIDQFAAALKPDANGDGTGPLSGRILYRAVDGQGDKMRQTLEALSGALKIGVNNKDALSTIVIKLNELTQLIATNDQTVRDFSKRITQVSGLLAQQAPGLQAVLAQLSTFLNNTSTVLNAKQQPLTEALTRFNATLEQLRRNAWQLTEVIDVTPMLFESIDRSMKRDTNQIRLHAQLQSNIDGDLLRVFCEKLLLRSDGCSTRNLKDFGPDLGITAALMGLTAK